MKHIIYISLLLLGLSSGYAQLNTGVITYELEDNISGATRNYVARETITMLPGFQYNAVADNALTARIDENIVASIIRPSSEQNPSNWEPDTDKFVGTLKGQFNVTEDGAANYAIPIDLPEGINGLKPSLVINYNSRSRNGILGYGFSLNGTSAITRCGQSVFTNGEIIPVQLDEDMDKAMLDGVPLIAFNWTEDGTGGTPDYWTNNSTYRMQNGSASIITYYTGTYDYFEVETATGQRMIYGNMDKARLGDNDRGILAWYLTEIIDAFGNSIHYSYRKVESTNEIVLDEITYADVRVKMYYTRVNTKSPEKLLFGTILDSELILDKIGVRVNSIPYMTHELEYFKSVNSNYYYLRNITAKGKNEAEKNPISINWGSYNVGSSEFHDIYDHLEAHIPGRPKLRYYTATDLNGDGKAELISYPTNAAYSPITIFNLNGNFNKHVSDYLPTDYNHILPGDFNGDGKTDLIFHKGKISPYKNIFSPGFSFAGATDILDKGIIISSFDAATNGLVQQTAATTNYGITGLSESKEFDIANGDFDGDGTCDLIFVDPSGNAFVFFGDKGESINFTKGREFSISNVYGIYTGDYNGDGKTDIFYGTESDNNNDGNIFVKSFINGKDEDPHESMVLDAEISGSRIHIQDINGDGTSDIRLGNTWYFSPGLIGSEYSTVAVETSWTSYGDMVNDFNHDGIAEFSQIQVEDNAPYADNIYETIVYKGFSGVHNNFANAEVITNGHAYKRTGELICFSYFHCDFNGDGFPDVFIDFFSEDNEYSLDDIYRDHPTPKLNYHTYVKLSGSAKPPLLVNTIRDGFNNKTTITYNPLNEVYSEDESYAHNYDENNIIKCLPISVVSSYTGGVNTFDYNYTNAIINLQGKGILGFSEINSTDRNTGISRQNIKKFFDAQNCIHRYNETWIKEGSVVLKEIRNSYDSYNYSTASIEGNCYFIYQTGNLQRGSLLPNMKETKFHYLDNYLSDGIQFPHSVSKWIDAKNVEFVSTSYERYGTRNSFFRPDVTSIFQYREGENEIRTYTDLDYKYTDKTSMLIEKETITYSGEVGGSYPSGQIISEFIYDDDDGSLLSKSVEAESNYSDGSQDLISRTTSYSYSDNKKHLEEETTDLGTVKSEYNDIGLLKAVTDIHGLKMRYEYNDFYQLTSTVDPRGISHNIELAWAEDTDPDNSCYYKLESATNNSYVKTFYDKLDRKVGIETELLGGKTVVSTIKYNSKGQVIEKAQSHEKGTSPKVIEHTSYLPDGRISSTYINDNIQKSIYSYNGKTFTRTKNGQTFTNVLDPYGTLESSTGPNGEISYSYYADGKLKQSTASGNTVTYQYDSYRNPASISDMSSGTITSLHNGLGDILETTDANGVQRIFAYDNLGRTTRVDYSDGSYTTYLYDTKRMGALSKVEHFPDNSSEEYFYDDFGKVTQIAEVFDGITANTFYKFNEFGDLKTIIYPSGFSVDYNYDTKGNLTHVNRGDNDELIWQAGSLDERGNWESYSFGNGLSTSFEYDASGLPSEINMTANPPSVYPTLMEYSFDIDKGVLNSRKDAWDNKNEVFGYKNQSMLQSWQVGSGTEYTMGYNDNNAITSKTDITNSITYAGANPHQVEQVIPIGNSIPEDFQNISYNQFNKVKEISEDADEAGTMDKQMTFYYNHAAERKKVEYKEADVLKWTKYYFGGNYEKLIQESNEKEMHFISGGDGVVAVFIKDNEGADIMHYVQKDYLGSWIQVSNDNNSNIEKYNYDAWGRQRNSSNWEYTTANLKPFINRGFTGHEHIPEFNLINMNGRVYDPMLGMFISPDPYLQDPENPVNFNRYAYCFNNPLVYTDPDGEFIVLTAVLIGAAIGTYQGYKIAQAKGATGMNMAGYMLGGAVIGGIAGVASAGVGIAVGSAVATAGIGGFAAGAITGAAVGATSGAITGFGMTALGGGTMAQAAAAAGKAALIGAAAGAVLGGTMQGIGAVRQGKTFWTGADKNPIHAPGRTINLTEQNPTKSEIKIPDDWKGEIKPINNNSRFTVSTRPQEITYTTADGVKVTMSRPQINGYDQSLTGKTDLYHSFPRSFDKTIINGGDWAQRVVDKAAFFQAPGTLNGSNGMYQIGINNNGVIFHRTFIPNF